RGQPPLQHPFRLVLLGRDVAHRVPIEALRRTLHLDIGDEAVFVLLAERGDLFAGFNGGHYAASSARTRCANFASDAITASTSACVEFQPKLTRKAERARSSAT